MTIKNQRTHWGFGIVFIHWLVAICIFGLFGLGLWMTDLSYYDPWYRQGPFIHKSIGVLLAIIMLFRVALRLTDKAPDELPTHKKWEKTAAKFAHISIYLLIFLIIISGYLISTADGRAISVFDLFELPATLIGIPNQEDIAGQIHYFAACTLIILVFIHMGGALKHHFIDKDSTLARMLYRTRN